MVKEIILIGSSSELAIEFKKKLEGNNGFKTHTISSNLDSKPSLLVNEYFKDSDKISTYISKLEKPYIIFFNGYLRENRPKYYPDLDEIFKTFKINFQIPLFLTTKIDSGSKDAKFIYISTFAAIKSREKNFVYGISKTLLEKNIVKKNINYLFLRFGKIKTKMSEDHADPPFTLSKSEAASLIIKFLDKEGIVYPTIGLKIMSAIIKILPSKLLDLIEKNRWFKRNRRHR